MKEGVKGEFHFLSFHFIVELLLKQQNLSSVTKNENYFLINGNFVGLMVLPLTVSIISVVFMLRLW